MININFRYKIYFLGFSLLGFPLHAMELPSSITEKDVNAPDEKGYTRLHHACLAGKADEVKTLIAQGANVNIKTQSGPIEYIELQKIYKNRIATPLHCAAISGNCQIINMLVAAGAAINSQYEQHDNTPLHLATWFGRPHTVRTLIEHGALLSIKNGHGSTPVHSAAWKNEPECLKILVENDADWFCKNETGFGNTPLYLAAKAGSRECLNLLIRYAQNAGNIEAYLAQKCSGTGTTAFQVAVNRWHVQCCWDLKCAGADYSWSQIQPVLVDGFRPFSLFLKYAAWGNTPYVDLPNKACLFCNHNFVKNNVVIKLDSCNHLFHDYCFERYAIKSFIEVSRDLPLIKELFNKYQAMYLEPNKVMYEVEHYLRTNMLVVIHVPDECPSCQLQISDTIGTLSIVS